MNIGCPGWFEANGYKLIYDLTITIMSATMRLIQNNTGDHLNYAISTKISDWQK